MGSEGLSRLLALVYPNSFLDLLARCRSRLAQARRGFEQRTLRVHRSTTGGWMTLAVAIAVLLPVVSPQAREASVFPWNRHIDTRNSWRPVTEHRDAARWSPGSVSAAGASRRVVLPNARPVAPASSSSSIYGDYDYDYEEYQMEPPSVPSPYQFWSTETTQRTTTSLAPGGQPLLLGESFYHQLARERTSTTKKTTTTTTTTTTQKPSTTTSKASTKKASTVKAAKNAPRPSSYSQASTTSLLQQLLRRPNSSGGSAEQRKPDFASLLGALMAPPTVDDSPDSLSLPASLQSNGDNNNKVASSFAELLKQRHTTRRPQKKITTTTVATTSVKTTPATKTSAAAGGSTKRPPSFLSSLLGILARPRPRPVKTKGKLTTKKPIAKKTTTTTTTTTTQKPTPPADEEVEKFDSGFHMFSQMFTSGGKPVDQAQSASVSVPQTGAPQPTSPTPQRPFYNAHRRPFQTSPPVQPTQPAYHPTTAPYYSSTHYYTTSRPYPYYNRPYPVEKIDGPQRPPNLPGVPYYYNTAAAAEPEAAPQINLNQLVGSVVQLMKTDGPSMMSGMSEALEHVQAGNYMGMIQSIMPVISQATPAIMNVINAVAPAIEKSDLLTGQTVDGSGGFMGVISSLLNGGKTRPQPYHGQGYSYVEKSDDGFNRPYYIGKVIGSGLKLATYLINYGTTVVRARDAGRQMPAMDVEEFADVFAEELEWVRETAGPENMAFIRDWVEQNLYR